MTETVTDNDSAPVIGPRVIGDTGVAVHPVAIDGSIFGWAAGENDTIGVLDVFADAGGDFISTADHYAGGRSEIMIGHWCRKRHNRDRVTIATKVGRHPDAPGLSAPAVASAVDASLRRLGTDRIDFLSLDGEHPETPIEETLEAVDELITAGKVRFMAAAGYSAEGIERVGAVAAERTLPDFTAFIAEYNLMDRTEYESAIEPFASRSGRAAIAKLPLASGYLTGKYRSKEDHPDSAMFDKALSHVGRRGSKVLGELEKVAREVGVSMSIVALGWVLMRPGIAAAAVRAKDTGQLTELIGASHVQLSRHQVAALDAASA